MRFVIICIMLSSLVASQEAEFEPITADNIERMRQVAEIPLDGSWLPFYGDLENNLILVSSSDGEYQLYDLVSGDLLRTVTPSEDDYWYAGFEDLIPPETIQRTQMLESVVAPSFESGYTLNLQHTFSPDGTRLVSFISTLWLPDPEARGTLIEVIASDGTRVNRIEYPYIVDHIAWSPDGGHFLAYASGVLPGQTPAVFTADGILVDMLDHGFPVEEALLGIEHVQWLDDTRILTLVSYRETFVRAAYIWDVTTSQRIATLLPDDGDEWRLAEATDHSRFVMWNRRVVRVVDDKGVLLGEFVNDGYADLLFVRDNNALLGWRMEAEPFRVLDLDGTVLGESNLPTVDLFDDIYDDFRRDFTADRNLMVASLGNDCRRSSPALHLWSLEDPATPLAEMPYDGYVRGPFFLADLIYAIIDLQPANQRTCDYEIIEQRLVFWNFSGERVLELPAPHSVTLVNNLLILVYTDRIEVWGVPS